MNIESYKKCSSAISLQGREKSVRKSSIRAREFVEQISRFSDLLGIVPEKEMVNSAMLEKKSVFEFSDTDRIDKNKREFIKSLSMIFDKVLEG